MAAMTWEDFKRMVDQKILEKGLDKDVPVWYIDVSHPEKRDDKFLANISEINVWVDKNLGLVVD